MKHLRKFNENISDELISYIRDILVDFISMGFRIDVMDLVNFDGIQLNILPKNFPNDYDHYDLIIDQDNLKDLMSVNEFIKNNTDYEYSHSFYFEYNNLSKIKSNVFKSNGKSVSLIQMFYK